MTEQPDITIIGAGMGGILAGMQLVRHGYRNFRIIEKAGDMGGTWRDNEYPGCACDVPSHFYSFSFEGKPDWSSVFPPRDEIFEYQARCATKYGLYNKTQFNTQIASAIFDSKKKKWVLKTTTGKTIRTDILITALGQLNRPKIPVIQGQDIYEGHIFHSAQWQHDVKLEGKKIAVIGNGPSAAQFIPEIAKIAGGLTIFQRSPCHVTPRNDRAYWGIEKFMFRYVPGLRKLYRGLIYWTLEKNFLAFNEAKNPHFLVRLFGLGKTIEEAIKEQFDEQVTDPIMREKLWPDYPIGCKRVVISDDYYPALMRDNVTVETRAIKKITKTGIQTNDGQDHKFDTIIYGTGFESTEFLAPLEIKGENETSLNQAWHDGAEAYLGMTMPDFPNFFMLYGPNTNLGHNSIIFMLECQMNYILGALKMLEEKKAHHLNLRQDKMQDFSEDLRARLSTSVWEAGCDSWYKNEAGKVTNNWPDFTYIYRQKTEKFDAAPYDFS